MIGLYRTLTGIVHPMLAVWSGLRRASNPALHRDRMGGVCSSGPIDIWIHAASVGETKIASYLIDYLQSQKPGLRIHLTVMTEAGYRASEQLMSETVTRSYFPYDTPRAMAATLDRLSPKMIVIAETEIWPNFLTEASLRSVPVVLMNGRMSLKAFGRYQLIRRSLGKLLKNYDRLFFKTEEDVARFVELGAKPDRTVVAGDMKFDARPISLSEGRLREIRFRLSVPDGCFLLVAGSTRPGEEELLLNALESIKSENSSIRLVLAPRHVDRAEEIRTLLETRNITSFVYGEEPREAEVVLVDRMGLLAELYAASDAAFVGGTLVNIGGHNLLEPVWAGRPVLFGPSLANVQEAAEYIVSKNFGKEVSSDKELASAVKCMMDGSLTFAQRGDDDLSQSPTATVGQYILNRLENV